MNYTNDKQELQKAIIEIANDIGIPAHIVTEYGNPAILSILENDSNN